MKRFRVLMTIGLSLGASMALVSCGGSSGSSNSAPASAPTFSNFQAASVVIGQQDFTTPGQACPLNFDQIPTSSTTNPLAVTASTIWCPIGNPGSGSLYLPDSANNRVLVYSTVPTANHISANAVLGQPDFATTTPGVLSMSRPETSIIYNGKLLVADTLNHRVLIWNTKPISSSVPADVVVGQPDMATVTSACDSGHLQNPESIAIVNGALVVADTFNNRVLMWKTIPTTSGVPADYVLGQVDFNHCGTPPPSGNVFSLPYDVLSIGGKLAVADLSDHRVLIWNNWNTVLSSCTPTPADPSYPAHPGCAITTPADVVMGQPDFTSTTPNTGGISGTTFYYPSYLATDGTRLAVADSFNHRVLIWNTVPTCTPTPPASNCAANTPANVVLGQPNFVSSTVNNDGTGNSSVNARGLNTPSGLAFVSSNQLLVMDTFNSRALVFNAQ